MLYLALIGGCDSDESFQPGERDDTAERSANDHAMAPCEATCGASCISDCVSGCVDTADQTLCLAACESQCDAHCELSCEDDHGLVCGEAPPSSGPCPVGCDECHDGFCYRYCSEGECQGEFVGCPAKWSCRVLCVGKDSCKNTTVACAGSGACEVECVGDNACAEADVVCGAGPCTVTCGAGSPQPCEELDVHCGGNQGELRCEEPLEGAGPELIGSQNNACGCTTDCEPAV